MNLRLALVSNNPDTLDGVTQYFERLGARLSAVPRIEEALERTRDSDVVVLFADDYPHEAAHKTVDALSTRLIVVVTAEVSAFASPRAAKDSPSRILVLARPAWGWMLLDAVRQALPGASGETS